jgi:hypothetical protein
MREYDVFLTTASDRFLDRLLREAELELTGKCPR